MRLHTTAMLLLLLAATTSLPAQESLDLLYTGHLDHDAHPDTVFGRPTGELRMLATAIHWGTPYPGTGDAGPRTILRYPDWPGLEGSFAVEDVTRDGAADLLLFFNAAAPYRRDSSRAIAIPAQDRLHDIAVVALGALERPIQRRPFVAVDIAALGLLVDRDVRDLSGLPSHRWGELPIGLADSSGPASIAPTLAEWMALYPNPASAAATLEAHRLAPGEYTLELVDIEGTIHDQRSLRLEREQSLSSTLDLSDHPPGLYMVRIRRAGELVASYPVVVVR